MINKFHFENPNQIFSGNYPCLIMLLTKRKDLICVYRLTVLIIIIFIYFIVEFY